MNSEFQVAHTVCVVLCFVAEMNNLAHYLKGLDQVQVQFVELCQCLSGAVWHDEFNFLPNCQETFNHKRLYLMDVKGRRKVSLLVTCS